MKFFGRWIAIAAVVLVAPLLMHKSGAQEGTPQGSVGPGVPPFMVRPGYRVTLAAQNLGEARFIEFGNNGTLYLSQPGRGNIVTLRYKGDGTYETIGNFITGKPTVHGMQFKDGWLWFTQSGAIFKARDTNNDGTADETVTVIPEGQLPSGGGHWWRSILVTDDSIYTSIGDDGNINDHMGDDREKIWRYNLDGSNKRLFCSGLRNTEKLRLRPGTDEIWGSDHGSDNMGGPIGEGKWQPPTGTSKQPFTDAWPPEEFNYYVQDGFYGHPFVVGNKVPRQEFINRPDILDLIFKTVSPEWSAGAHWAGNGWTFLTKDYFPNQKGNAWVAYHGSWNSVKKVGYRVESILFDPMTGRPCGSQMIVSTLAANGNDVLARPVDCAEAPDGSILFTSDQGASLYRITYTGRRFATTMPQAAVATNASTTAPAKNQAQATPIAHEFEPLSYFASNCARCHGPNGSFYGATFGQKLTDQQLRDVVKAMADGPGNAPLSDADLAIEVAYHRSLIDKQPFIALTHSERQNAGLVLKGEATPDASVKVMVGDKTIEAKTDYQNWTATLPRNSQLPKVQIMAVKGGQKTTLDLSKSNYSHRQPMSAPSPQ